MGTLGANKVAASRMNLDARYGLIQNELRMNAIEQVRPEIFAAGRYWFSGLIRIGELLNSVSGPGAVIYRIWQSYLYQIAKSGIDFNGYI